MRSGRGLQGSIRRDWCPGRLDKKYRTSDSRDENEDERASRWPQALCSSAPQKSPPPGCACRDAGLLVLGTSGPGLRGTPMAHPGVAGGCTGRLEVFAHAAEARAPSNVVAPAPWCAATASARDCKSHGADARRAGPGWGAAPAAVGLSPWRREPPVALPRSIAKSFQPPGPASAIVRGTAPRSRQAAGWQVNSNTW